jgi:hypothetical protein
VALLTKRLRPFKQSQLKTGVLFLYQQNKMKMVYNNYQGALQHPIGTGFNAQSTTADVIKGIDLSSRIAIVTGGNSGIGLETSKTLATAGATVIVPARDVEKAKKNLEGIANVEIEALDIMDSSSINAFAENFLSFRRHHMSPFNFEDPNFEDRAKRYNVRAYSVHPGSIGGTELGREAPVELFQKMGFLDENGKMRPEVLASLKTIPQGAATTVWVATSPQLNSIGGIYSEDCDIAELIFSDPAIPTKAKLHVNGVQQYSLDEENAKRLWILTEQMTGLQFEVK